MDLIANGVLQFSIPPPARGGRTTLAYCLESPSGRILIDTGWDSDDGFKALKDQLTANSIEPEDVALICITHGHIDHIGLSNRVRRLTGAPVAIHGLDAENPAVTRFEHGVTAPIIDRLLKDGEELLPGTDIWALWTPGHTPGHLCFYDRGRRLLFTGDHILPRITPNVGLNIGQRGNPLEQFLGSLRRLKLLDVDMVHPAHESSFPDLATRIDELMAHHDERARQALDLINGSSTAWQVASRMAWRDDWESMPLATQRSAHREVAAHLEYLAYQGQLARVEGPPDDLLDSLRWLAGEPDDAPTLLVGAGTLGKAALHLAREYEVSLEFVVAFDADARQWGARVAGVPIEGLDQLEEEVRGRDLKRAVMAVPEVHAPDTLRRLVSAGVDRVLSFVDVVAPPEVDLRVLDGLIALESSVSYHRP